MLTRFQTPAIIVFIINDWTRAIRDRIFTKSEDSFSIVTRQSGATPAFLQSHAFLFAMVLLRSSMGTCWLFGVINVTFDLNNRLSRLDIFSFPF